MENKQIIQFLNCLQGKSAIVKSSGYISCQAVIYELEYVIKYEIVTIKDAQMKNFIVIDLKKIKEIKLSKDKISILIFMNDEVETEIAITEVK